MRPYAAGASALRASTHPPRPTWRLTREAWGLAGRIARVVFVEALALDECTDALHDVAGTSAMSWARAPARHEPQ